MAVVLAPPRENDRDFYLGEAADTKPLSAVVGSLFYETDTGLWFIWDGAAWAAYHAPAPAA